MDNASRSVLRRFAFTLAFIVGWYLIWRDDSAIRFSIMALVASACVVSVAVARREPAFARTLTRWDEAAAWFLLASGVGILEH
jgi:hypothetical protein